jgi:glycosyltransferase involved in cell wall biosynthesis
MQQISEGLASRGHDVTVATASHGNHALDNHAGVRIARFNVTGNAATGYGGDVAGYQRFVREWEGDVMLNYAAQICTTDLVFPLLAELNCRKVLVPCGYSGLYMDAFADYFRDLPQSLREYDMLVYLSGNYRDNRFGDEHGLDRWTIIGNGASEEEFGQPVTGFRDAYGIAEPRMFLCVSNFGEQKGQQQLIRAFSASGVRDAALVLIGSEFNRFAEVWLTTGTTRADRLRRRAKEAMITRGLWHAGQRTRWVRRLRDRNGSIYVLSNVPRQMIVSAYHEADLFLLASHVECAPLVLYEAMASGTPFLSTDVGNARELKGGVVAPAEGFADAMRNWAGEPDRWRSLGQLGRSMWHESATWSRLVQQYEHLYESLRPVTG